MKFKNYTVKKSLKIYFLVISTFLITTITSANTINKETLLKFKIYVDAPKVFSQYYNDTTKSIFTILYNITSVQPNSGRKPQIQELIKINQEVVGQLETFILLNTLRYTELFLKTEDKDDHKLLQRLNKYFQKNAYLYRRIYKSLNANLNKLIQAKSHDPKVSTQILQDILNRFVNTYLQIQQKYPKVTND